MTARRVLLPCPSCGHERWTTGTKGCETRRCKRCAQRCFSTAPPGKSVADLRPDLAALFLSTSRYTPEEVGVHSNRVVIAACSGCGEPRERQVFYLAKHPRCRACTRTRQDTVEQVVCPDCKRLRTVAYYDREVAKHRPCPKCASKAT